MPGKTDSTDTKQQPPAGKADDFDKEKEVTAQEQNQNSAAAGKDNNKATDDEVLKEQKETD